MPIREDAHRIASDAQRRIRLLFQNFPRTHNLVLLGQPTMMHTLALSVSTKIRAARRASLPALLPARGVHLRDTGAVNYHIHEHPDILVKNCFLTDPNSQRAGTDAGFYPGSRGLVEFADAPAAIGFFRFPLQPLA